MYSNLFLDNKIFEDNNLLNLQDIDYYLKNFSSVFKTSIIYGPSRTEIANLIGKLEKKQIVETETIEILKATLLQYKSFKTDNIDTDFSKDEIITILQQIKKTNNKIEIAILCYKLINKIFTNNYNEKTRSELFSKIKIILSSIDKFPYDKLIDVDNYEHNNKLKGTDIKKFFNNEIRNLVNLSTNISILDRYCLSSLIRKSKKTTHGFNHLFELIEQSDVKKISIICGFNQEEEKNSNGKKVNIIDIVDIFKDEVLNNIFFKYSENANSQNHSQNIFNNMDFGKLKTDKLINSSNISLSKKELILEIEIKIIDYSYFKTRDRFILFDEHSAINIHDINSWSSANGMLKKDTICSVLPPNTKIKQFYKYQNYPVLASIAPIKYYK